jgi:hypothetical protein
VQDIIREGEGDREDLPRLPGRCSKGSEHLEVLEKRAKEGVERGEVFEREGVLGGRGRRRRGNLLLTSGKCDSRLFRGGCRLNLESR